MRRFFNPTDYLPCKNCSHSKKILKDSELPSCKVTGCQYRTYKGYIKLNCNNRFKNFF